MFFEYAAARTPLLCRSIPNAIWTYLSHDYAAQLAARSRTDGFVANMLSLFLFLSFSGPPKSSVKYNTLRSLPEDVFVGLTALENL